MKTPVNKPGFFYINKHKIPVMVLEENDAKSCKRCGGKAGTVQITENTMIGNAQMLLAGTLAEDTCLTDVKFLE